MQCTRALEWGSHWIPLNQHTQPYHYHPHLITCLDGVVLKDQRDLVILSCFFTHCRLKSREWLHTQSKQANICSKMKQIQHETAIACICICITYRKHQGYSTLNLTMKHIVMPNLKQTIVSNTVDTVQPHNYTNSIQTVPVPSHATLRTGLHWHKHLMWKTENLLGIAMK